MDKNLNDGLIVADQVQKVLEKNADFLTTSLKKVTDELLASYPKKQAETGKSELKYIYISLLRSAVPFKLPLYRVDFYDEQGQLDLVEHAEYWDISPVSDIIYTDVFSGDNPYYKLSGRENYGNEKNWVENANVLHNALGNIVADIFRSIAMDIPDNSKHQFSFIP